MPTPDAPSGRSDATATILALFRQVHDQLRDEMTGLDDEALNWVPTAGANSIAAIVTHLVGSEAETLRSVAGIECERDRDAEFMTRDTTMGEVIGLLDRADALLAELEPALGQSRLEAVFSLPTLPPEEIRPGITWLVGN